MGTIRSDHDLSIYDTSRQFKEQALQRTSIR